MKTRYFLICAVLLCVFLTACHKAPDATDSNGKSIRLADYHGKWVLVNYWATWCQPCLTELPVLNTLYKQHADKLVVLGVNFDGLSAADIRRFGDSLHLSFPLLSSSPLAKFHINDIPTLPATFIINPQGKLIKTLYGPQTKDSLLESLKN